MKKKLVVLTGAGISAESGLKTFRDAGGLWEGYDMQQVATPEAWQRDPALVQRFYNERRAQVRLAKPNSAHFKLAGLEDDFDVQIITQNIDDLHERAGSSQVTHLHGIITRAQSSKNPALTYPISGDELKMGELCDLGSQLRPHVVWFGEAVPMIEKAVALCMQSDLFLLIGTSLAVYPAAGLLQYVPQSVSKYIIDPNTPPLNGYRNVIAINKSAVAGMDDFVKMIDANG